MPVSYKLRHGSSELPENPHWGFACRRELASRLLGGQNRCWQRSATGGLSAGFLDQCRQMSLMCRICGRDREPSRCAPVAGTRLFRVLRRPLPAVCVPAETIVGTPLLGLLGVAPCPGFKRGLFLAATLEVCGTRFGDRTSWGYQWCGPF